MATDTVTRQPRALVLWADGFEEIEAIAPVDVLRRAGVDVVIGGVGGLTVASARGMRVLADVAAEELSAEDFDVVVLPGGLGGARALAASDAVRALIEGAAAAGRLVAAQCAAPAIVLGPLGLLDGRRATCYPSMRPTLRAGSVVDAAVVVDGPFITGAGPGTALAFSLAVAEALVGPDAARAVAAAMLVAPSPTTEPPC